MASPDNPAQGIGPPDSADDIFKRPGWTKEGDAYRLAVDDTRAAKRELIAAGIAPDAIETGRTKDGRNYVEFSPSPETAIQLKRGGGVSEVPLNSNASNYDNMSPAFKRAQERLRSRHPELFPHGHDGLRGGATDMPPGVNPEKGEFGGVPHQGSTGSGAGRSIIKREPSLTSITEPSSLTNRQRIDALIKALPTRNFGEEKLHIPLENIGIWNDVAAGYKIVMSKLEPIFGQDSGISCNIGFGERGLNIPLRLLRSLDEKKCGEVIAALVPVIEREVELGHEYRALKTIIGDKFEVIRTRYDGKNKYYITQRTWGKGGCDEAYGVNISETDASACAANQRRAYYPMRHLAQCLNQALGDDLFTGGWHEGQFAYLLINEDDIPLKLLKHDKLKAAQEVFVDPLKHCGKYERSTIIGRIKGALGLNRAIPVLAALEHGQPQSEQPTSPSSESPSVEQPLPPGMRPMPPGINHKTGEFGGVPHHEGAGPAPGPQFRIIAPDAIFFTGQGPQTLDASINPGHGYILALNRHDLTPAAVSAAANHTLRYGNITESSIELTGRTLENTAKEVVAREAFTRLQKSKPFSRFDSYEQFVRYGDFSKSDAVYQLISKYRHAENLSMEQLYERHKTAIAERMAATLHDNVSSLSPEAATCIKSEVVRIIGDSNWTPGDYNSHRKLEGLSKQVEPLIRQRLQDIAENPSETLHLAQNHIRLGAAAHDPPLPKPLGRLARLAGRFGLIEEIPIHIAQAGEKPAASGYADAHLITNGVISTLQRNFSPQMQAILLDAGGEIIISTGNSTSYSSFQTKHLHLKDKQENIEGGTQARNPKTITEELFHYICDHPGVNIRENESQWQSALVKDLGLRGGEPTAAQKAARDLISHHISGTMHSPSWDRWYPTVDGRGPELSYEFLQMELGGVSADTLRKTFPAGYPLYEQLKNKITRAGNEILQQQPHIAEAVNAKTHASSFSSPEPTGRSPAAPEKQEQPLPPGMRPMPPGVNPEKGEFGGVHPAAMMRPHFEAPHIPASPPQKTAAASEFHFVIDAAPAAAPHLHSETVAAPPGGIVHSELASNTVHPASKGTRCGSTRRSLRTSLSISFPPANRCISPAKRWPPP